MMESKKCFYQNSEIVRHINIHRDFLDMLMNEKGLNTYGNTLLFFYLRLSAQCYLSKGKTSSSRHQYVDAGEFVTTDRELVKMLGLKSRKKMYEILNRMSALGLIQCEIGPKLKHCVVELFIRVERAAECRSNKVYGTPKHGFLITERNLLYQLIPEDGSTRFSDMDIFLSLWIHTVYNDIYVPVSSMVPVVVFNGNERTPLYSSRMLCKHFNCSAPRINNCIRSFIKCGLLKTYNFYQAGYVMQPVEFARYMFGEDVETVNDLEGMQELFSKMGSEYKLDSSKFEIKVQEERLDAEAESNENEGKLIPQECNKKDEKLKQEECNEKERNFTPGECKEKEGELNPGKCKENLEICADSEFSSIKAESNKAGCKENLKVCSEDICGGKTAAAPGYDWEKTDGAWPSAGDIESSHEEADTCSGDELRSGFPIMPDLYDQKQEPTGSIHREQQEEYREVDARTDGIYGAGTYLKEHGREDPGTEENTVECACSSDPVPAHCNKEKFTTTAAIVGEKRNGRAVRRIIFDRSMVEQIMDHPETEMNYYVVLSITKGVKKFGAGKNSGGFDEQEGTAITGGGG